MKRTTSPGQRPGPLKEKHPAARLLFAENASLAELPRGDDKQHSLRDTAKTGTRVGSKARLDPRELVRSSLENYAQRGVFSGFGQADGPGGKTLFACFIWLHDRHMELTLEPANEVLRFDRILPGVKAGTPLAVDLKRLIALLRSDDVPAYRRVDPRVPR